MRLVLLFWSPPHQRVVDANFCCQPINQSSPHGVTRFTRFIRCCLIEHPVGSQGSWRYPESCDRSDRFSVLKPLVLPQGTSTELLTFQTAPRLTGSYRPQTDRHQPWPWWILRTSPPPSMQPRPKVFGPVLWEKWPTKIVSSKKMDIEQEKCL